MKRIVFASFGLICLGLYVQAQPTDPSGGDLFVGTNQEIAAKLLQWYNFAFLFAGYLGTYLSRFIPYLNRVNNLAWRAALIGVFVGAIFWRMGADGLGLSVAFLTLINPYEMALKPTVGPTKPNPPVK